MPYIPIYVPGRRRASEGRGDVWFAMLTIPDMEKAPMLKKLIPMLLLATMLPACQGTNLGSKQTVGTVGGAALGGLLGNQFGGGTGNVIATGLGVFLGGLLGSEVGKSLDRADEQYAYQAQSTALSQTPIGQPVQWSNPQSGNYGTVTPTAQGYMGNQLCREFQQTVYVGGRSERASGTACRQADGSWRIVSQ